MFHGCFFAESIILVNICKLKCNRHETKNKIENEIILPRVYSRY